MKIVNAKKIMGAVALALLVGCFASCGQDNLQDIGNDENNYKVTEVAGYAKAVATGIDFTAFVDRIAGFTDDYLVKEVASGITFPITSSSTRAVYPFVKADKTYKFEVSKKVYSSNTNNAPVYVKEGEFTILATGGDGELKVAEKAFGVEAKKEEYKFNLVAHKGDNTNAVDYFANVLKAFGNDKVTSASVTYKVNRSDYPYSAETTVTPAWNTTAKQYEYVIAKSPVYSGIGITGVANNDAWYTLLGNEWYIRETVTLNGSNSGLTFTYSDKVTTVEKNGEKAKVLLAYNTTNIGTIQTVYNSGSNSGNTVFGEMKAETKGLDTGTTYKTRFTYSNNVGKNVKIYSNPSSTYTNEEWALNTIEVFYGDVVAFPQTIPTLTYQYFKGQDNPYLNYNINISTFTSDTTVNYTFTGYSNAEIAVNTTGYIHKPAGVPVVTDHNTTGTNYYKVLLTAERTASFADKNERQANYR